MYKIGNIVTSETDKQRFGLFNVVEDCGLIDNSLPTLIIGFDKAKRCIENFSILNKSYNDGMLQWTFGKKERRKDHNVDIEHFTEYCILHNVQKVKYKYIDIINYDLSKIKKLISYIKGTDVKYCFITKNANFIFIYSKRYNVVWGLSLTLCEYLGIHKQKVISLIKKNQYNNIINDISIINDDIRKRIGNNTHYILPIYQYFV